MGRFVDESLPEFCRHVARPAMPSPAGGSVIGVVAALAASLATLVGRVSEGRSGQTESRVAENKAMQTSRSLHEPPTWQAYLQQVDEIRIRLMNYAEEDVYDAARLFQHSSDANARRSASATQKIAEQIVRLLELLKQMAPVVDKRVASDLRVTAHLLRAAALAVSEIEWDNARARQADAGQLQELVKQRDYALRLVDELLSGHTV